jgi:hypothetical protein
MDSLDNPSQSLEDIHTLPDYAPNVLPEWNDRELPVLTLTSHGHSPPLHPTPDLRIDVRNLPNPPKHIRDAYKGTSKRLQEWMKENPVFIARRDAIRMEILAAMTQKMDEHERKDVLKVELDEQESGDQSSSKTQDLVTDESNVTSDEEEDDINGDVSSPGDEESDQVNDNNTLRVGIFCAMGRHRSVAMVEELAKMSWPGWQVKVEHRDISKKRGQGKNAGGRDKKSRGTRGGASSYVDDDCK